jgi:hypothetical protein
MRFTLVKSLFAFVALVAFGGEVVGAQSIPDANSPATRALSAPPAPPPTFARSFALGTIRFDAFERARAASASRTPFARAMWPFSGLAKTSTNFTRRSPLDTATTVTCPYPDGCGDTGGGKGFPAYAIALLVVGAGGLTYVLVNHPHPSTTSRDATPTPTPSEGAASATETPNPGTTTRDQTPPPGTTSRETPTPMPTEAPTPNPTYTPYPTPTPTLVACRTWQTEGYLEPVQGTWQDDPTFDDRSGAQITEIKKFTYEAELPMIAFRDTVLYGIDHYEKDGERQNAPGHFTIVIRGLSTCQKTKPLHFQFWLRDGGTTQKLGEYIDQNIPLTGAPYPNNKKVEWTAFVPTETGFPFNKTFKVTGNYHVWGELVDKHDEPSGFRVDVFGKTNFTAFPNIVVAPVTISTDTTDPKGLANDIALLSADGRVTADELSTKGSDALPLKLGSVVAVARPTTNFALASHFSFTKQSELVARVTARVNALAALSKAGRIVVILRDEDFDEFNPTSFLEYFSKGKVVGIAIDSKVVLMRHYSGWDTAYHELLHTLPYLWSSSEMKSDCSRDYHNGADDGVANGVRIYVDGKLGNREWVDHKTAILGKGDDGFFVAQCTYAHLATALQKPFDPKTLLVRFTARENGATTFDPFYSLDGIVDAPQSAGTWLVTLRDAAGRALAVTHFTPNWDRSELRAHRDVESFAFRFADVRSATRVEIGSPHGIVATANLAPSGPALSIDAPADGAHLGGATSVRVRWHASDPSGAKLFANVRISNDGKLYDLRAFETDATTLTVPFPAAATSERIGVIVTNGTRSTEREITVRR